MNRQDTKAEQEQTESIEDLEVKTENAGDTRAGAGAFSGGGIGASPSIITIEDRASPRRRLSCVFSPIER
jgi:hypothetical protein